MFFNAEQKKFDLGDDCYVHDSMIGSKKVIALIRDEGGQIPYRTHTICISCFQSLEDFVGYLFFAEIPRILSWSTYYRDRIEHNNATLVLMAPEDLRVPVMKLFADIESILRSDRIEVTKVLGAIELFNEIFIETEPSVNILAFGENPLDLLLDPYFHTALEEDAVHVDDNGAEYLKKLIDNNGFSLTNRAHRELAIGYIESKCRNVLVEQFD